MELGPHRRALPIGASPPSRHLIGSNRPKGAGPTQSPVGFSANRSPGGGLQWGHEPVTSLAELTESTSTKDVVLQRFPAVVIYAKDIGQS